MDDLPRAQYTLAEYMSELSEEAYEARWMHGLEYILWKMVLDGPTTYGRLDTETSQVEKLKVLSAACAGWIVFDPEHAETFVPIERWRVIYKEHEETGADRARH